MVFKYPMSNLEWLFLFFYLFPFKFDVGRSMFDVHFLFRKPSAVQPPTLYPLPYALCTML